MYYMDTKIKKPKELKEETLTVRLKKSERILLSEIRKALSKQSFSDVNETQGVVASLRIAAEKLNVKVSSG